MRRERERERERQRARERERERRELVLLAKAIIATVTYASNGHTHCAYWTAGGDSFRIVSSSKET